MAPPSTSDYRIRSTPIRTHPFDYRHHHRWTPSSLAWWRPNVGAHCHYYYFWPNGGDGVDFRCGTCSVHTFLPIRFQRFSGVKPVSCFGFQVPRANTFRDMPNLALGVGRKASGDSAATQTLLLGNTNFFRWPHEFPSLIGCLDVI